MPIGNQSDALTDFILNNFEEKPIIHSLKSTINFGLMAAALSFGLMISASAKSLETSADPIQELIDKMAVESVQKPSAVDYFTIGSYYEGKARKAKENRNKQEAQKNYAIAFQWFQKLANLKGEPSTMFTSMGQMEIADMYFHGQGVQTNKAKAAELYKKDCEETGNARPCSLMGIMQDGVAIETPELNGIADKDWVEKVTKFKQ